MTRRMIDSGMWSNENFAALPAMARLLQIGIINHADDQGRIKAHPAYLRSQIFAYDDVAIDDVRKWLDIIACNGTAIIYEVDGKEYVQLVKWWDYQSLQYAAPSEYPPPCAWQDRIRYNAKGGMVLTFNWQTVKGETLPDTCDCRGNLLSTQAVRPPETPRDNPPGTPPGSINKEQIKINTNKEQRESVAAQPTPQQEMFAAICEAVGWDYHTLSKDDKGQVAQLCGIFGKANPPYIVDDIRRFMVDIWFKDWRWLKEQQHPTLKQLRQEIGKLRSTLNGAAPPPPAKGIDGFRAMAARQGIEL